MSQDSEPEDPWGARREDKRGPAVASQPETAVPAPAATPSPAVDEGRVAQVAFSGTRGEWARIVLRGMALYVPTFGFYRFWLRTDQRRFLWRSIAVDGETLAYHGTARELLVGFLIAIAVYLPVTVAYSLLGLYAETVQAFASVPFALFLAVFGYYAMYRARRYRLTRTVFRGVRFWMDGSAWRFAFMALGWLFIVGLTLGLAWPWMSARLERFKWKHSHYGDLQGSFDGSGWHLFKALFLPAIGLVLGAFIPFANIIAIPAMLAVIIAVYSNWLVNGVCFGPVRLRSAMRRSALVVPAMITLALVVAVGLVWFGIGYAVFRNNFADMGRTFTPNASDSEIMASLRAVAPFLMALFAWGMIGLLALTTVKAIFFDFARVQALASAVTLTNAEALQSVIQKGQAEGSFGEGLADALGSDGF